MNERLLKIIGPALRGLKANGNILARVKYAEEEIDGGVPCSIPPDSDTSQVIEILKSTVQKDTTAVNVEGIGSFHITISGPGAGRATGKVAVVTGAAQGFGYEIACDMAKEGSLVVLGDINVDGVRSAAEKINGDIGNNIAVGIEMNVTNSASVAAAITETVKRFGGIDVFISNAGIVRAGSVKDMPEEEFALVSDINYKGYFICAQNAAPVMAVQHMAKPDSTSDIIQINSKSGLAGSNRNGAYAGSKFGGIGLTQSFALELVKDGIKVNSICPGNFFDGPLWSDPKDGLFAQYLESGKVPGAKTIDDVRKFYEAKVPMGRGCTTPDVMKAVYYIMEQAYETGQAVPVTGGQEMLR